ncbi:MAG: autotransporter domain-containing protein [Candidatus Omnitrophica bacterium]|nr:autotransporter domain-containing protein [Candidatus Omnitrophota bacterium]
MKKFLSAIAALSMVCLLSAPAFASNGQWISVTGGNWSTPGNWNTGPGPAPGTAQDDTIFLETTPTTTTTVTIDGGVMSRMAGVLNIGSNGGGSYTLQANGGGTLTFSSLGGTSTLNQVSWSTADNFISAPLLLDNSLDIANASDALLTVSGSITANAAGVNTITNKGAGNGGVTLSGIIANGGGGTVAINQDSDTSELTLSGANTYTGATTVTAGTLKAAGAGTNAFGTGSAVTVASNAILDVNGTRETIGSLAGAGTVTNNAFGTAVTLTVGSNNTSTTFSGVIKDGVSALFFTKSGAGTLTLSNANTYGGDTNINAGTVVAGNANALGNGSAVTVANGATLDVGTTNVTVNAVYTQQAGSNLNLTIASPSSSGKITSNADAVVSAASNVNVTVASSSYIPNKTTYTIIDGAAGAGVNVPGTITSSDPRLKFSAISSNGDLFLIVDRSGTGFSSLSTNSNAASAGTVLDNITTPSTDMTTVLNTLEGLSNLQTASALDSVTPVVDSGVTNVSNTSIIQFIGTSTDRLEGLFAQAHNEETGVSTGSEGRKGFEAWGRGFGEYAHQDPRGLSNGYHATIWGTAIGGDLPVFNDRVRLGLSGGYAASDINSKDNGGSTDIDSYQGALYGGFMDPEKPYYINGAFSFAFNNYKSSRNIAVGAIMRTANADYDGRQYSVLLDGGYTFKAGKKLRITPIASLQYLRLHLDGYTETNAGALNLAVNSQSYDMLQSGLGMKLDRSFEVNYGTIIPEIHAKWLYDFINDKQETTSTFSGGGGSFATNGFTPARSALDIGGRLALVTKGNWSFDANYDFEYKEDFTSHTGWADIRYQF